MEGPPPANHHEARCIPLLWLCGPPGVGKTAVAWEVYRRLIADGVRAAYLDVDQVGICHPAPPDDPERHGLQARNVGALRLNFAAAGATCVIVSGVVDPARGPGTAVLGEGSLVARLRADTDRLVARLHQRRGSSADVEAAVLEAELLDSSSFADWSLDTTALSIEDVAQQVLELSHPFLEASVTIEQRHFSPRPVDQPAPGELLWLTGATGVGKSTIGFAAYLEVWRAGVPAAFVDVDQLGFFGRSDHRLRAQNLASVWVNHQCAGAKVLLVVGPVETRADGKLYEDALRSVDFTWCRLHVSPDELARRVLSRGDGGSWRQPGDPLMHRPPEELIEVADRAMTHAAALEARDIGLRIAVDGLSAAEAAAKVLDHAAWPMRTMG